jgi:hypothetical protein
MVAQAKPHHLQELDNANSVEKTQHDAEKLQQVLLIVPEGTENNELNKDKNGSKIVKTAAVESPHQLLSLRSGNLEETAYL